MQKLKFVMILFSLTFISITNAQSNGIGVGLIVGEPTGISGKYWTGSTTAFDAGLAWSFIDENAFQIHADYIFHNMRMITIPDGKLPFYYGIGARLKTATDVQLGVRVPLGLAYIFQNAPIDIFIEVVPILDLLPKTDFQISVALGARYFFN
ncbi:MAG: hypothetical protein OQK57_09980 [Ignavibacteriaceae bacterium]|nr:hypothetical protein [Ignavibacteriaceae bacterium]